MKVWITRHGQTALNKQQLMQGLYDEPLNEVGIEQVGQGHSGPAGAHHLNGLRGSQPSAQESSQPPQRRPERRPGRPGRTGRGSTERVCV